MRAFRAIATLLAFALIGLVPATASADSAFDRSTVQERSSQRAAATVTAKVVKRRGKLFMVGKVSPAPGKVTIQKATKCNKKTKQCNFKFFKRDKVGKEGRYKVRVYAPNKGSWYWRARKGTTTSTVWRTYKI